MLAVDWAANGFSVAELVLGIITLLGAGYAGSFVLARMRSEDRRKILDELLPKLRTENLQVGHGDRAVLDEIGRLTNFLPWTDRLAWDRCWTQSMDVTNDQPHELSGKLVQTDRILTQYEDYLMLVTVPRFYQTPRRAVAKIGLVRTAFTRAPEYGC